jgi:hypothetical protein
MFWPNMGQSPPSALQLGWATVGPGVTLGPAPPPEELLPQPAPMAPAATIADAATVNVTDGLREARARKA